MPRDTLYGRIRDILHSYGYTVLAGKTKESFGELLRKRSGKEVVIYSDHLREHFMPEVFLLSPSPI